MIASSSRILSRRNLKILGRPTTIQPSLFFTRSTATRQLLSSSTPSATQITPAALTALGAGHEENNWSSKVIGASAAFAAAFALSQQNNETTDCCGIAGVVGSGSSSHDAR